MKKKMFDIQARDWAEPNKIYFVKKSELIKADKVMCRRAKALWRSRLKTKKISKKKIKELMKEMFDKCK